MGKTTLYYKSANGTIRFWSIYAEGSVLQMDYGAVGGDVLSDSENIVAGLGGRTIEEQIEMRIKSRVNKKLDKGYVYSIEEANIGQPTNSLGYKKPAKCKAYNEKTSIFEFDGVLGIQHKLNGHHASIVNDGGELIMYSSNGKVIDTLDEIMHGLEIPEGRTIEGELYHHGTPLQTISSWVKRKQKYSDNIKFMIYDIDGDETYVDRYGKLSSLELNDRCEVLNTEWIFGGEIDLDPLLKKAIENKYEGLVLRLDNYPHEAGKRSKGLIKVKPRHFDSFRVDDEFLVVNIKSSVDGWAILCCVAEDGAEFTVSCHGTMDYKKYVLKRKDEFIGKHIRCEFESYTKAKKPFHPVALEWREKFEEL